MKKKVKLNSLYYGFPVLLLTTTDNDGNFNVSPISSSISLNNKIIIGISKGGKTYDNLVSGSDAVINIPNFKLWKEVEELGRLTGKDTLSENQIKWGVQKCEDKASKVKLHTESAIDITSPRIVECPIQVECKNTGVEDKGKFILVELDVINTWIDSDLLNDNDSFNSSKWKPLIYNFREYNTTSETLGFNFKYGN